MMEAYLVVVSAVAAGARSRSTHVLYAAMADSEREAGDIVQRILVLPAVVVEVVGVIARATMAGRYLAPNTAECF